MSFDFSLLEDEFKKAADDASVDPGYMLDMVEASIRRSNFSRVVDLDD